MNIYSIKDKVAKEYGPAFSAKNDQVASRAFMLEIPTQFKANLEDFELWCIGEYDVETGYVNPDVIHQVDLNLNIALEIEGKKDA